MAHYQYGIVRYIRMILAGVHYGLFPGEAEALAGRRETDWHHIEGELRLDFTDSPARFVSWGNGPVLYAVEVRENSFFEDYMLASMDMSDHPYWCDLIGHEIKLKYADRDHQVLRIGSRASEVFLTSQCEDGSFQGNCLRISPVSPIILQAVSAELLRTA